MSKLSDQEVLRKCVAKAVRNGWRRNLFSYHDYNFIKLYSNGTVKVLTDNVGSGVIFQLNELLFSHPFAKALWGDSTPVLLKGMKGATHKKLYLAGILEYQFHLQEMVLAENPIDYLRNWLASKEGKE